VPEVWILGSSNYGAQVAAHFGLPYAFAWFFTDGTGGAEAIALYREPFKPSERHPQPHAALCVWALAAETEEQAAYEFGPRAHVRLLRDRGVFAPLPSPEEVAGYTYTPIEAARVAELRRHAFLGTGKQVAARISELAERVGVQEMAVVTWAHEEEVRRRSYHLLAEAAALG
jgi:luciferase family oxidoreductase group 1